MIKILTDVMIKMACAGKFLTASTLLAPTYWDTIEDIALRVCPKTQISIEINAPTIPTAPKDSVAWRSIFPTIAVSVIESIGSDIPEINAGIASLFICFKLICEDNSSRTFRISKVVTFEIKMCTFAV